MKRTLTLLSNLVFVAGAFSGCMQQAYDVETTRAANDKVAPNVIETTPPPANSSNQTLTDVAYGNSGGCAIRSGTAYCWGLYSHGLSSSETPKPIPGLPEGQVTHLAAGGHTRCAVAAGTAKCWGYMERYGEWGDATGGTNDFSGARQVVGLTDGVEAVFLSPLGETACAVKDQALYCWGKVFNSATPGAFSSTPLLVTDLGPRPAAGWNGRASLSEYHGCFIKSDDHLYCWGRNDSGQLGTGNQVSSSTPIKTMDGPVQQVAVSNASTCALKGGAVSCWGAATRGELGNGTTTPVRSLTAITPIGMNEGVTSLAQSHSYFCSIKNQQVHCWGYVPECVYMLPSEEHTSAPACVYHDNIIRSASVALPEFGSGILQISAGPYNLCARDSDQLLCKGGNSWGALATNTHLTANRSDIIREIPIPSASP